MFCIFVLSQQLEGADKVVASPVKQGIEGQAHNRAGTFLAFVLVRKGLCH